MKDHKAISILIRPTLFLLLMATLLAAASSLAAEGFDPTQAALGKSTFRAYCVSCHGKEAKGDGPVAEYLDPAPADLTKITERHDGTFPFELIYKVIDGRENVPGHGSPDMPVWGEAFKVADPEADEKQVEKKITQLVHFLQSIQTDD